MFSISDPVKADVQSCEAVLRALPDWFGIEEAIVQYVKDIEEMPTIHATVNGKIVGFLSVNRHNEVSAEIHVMGVLQEEHGIGIGSSMITTAEEYLKDDGVKLFQVKTLGPSHPDEGYAKTRAFYKAQGFLPLEEIVDFWEKGCPSLFMVKPL